MFARDYSRRCCHFYDPSLPRTLIERYVRCFRYHYAEKSSNDPWPSWVGVRHGDEIEFSFGHPLTDPKAYDVEEVSLAFDIITYWANFIRNGTPNPSRYFKTWPKYESPEWKYINFTAAETRVYEQTLADKCEFWNEVIPEILEGDDDEDDDDEDSDEDDDVDYNVCK